MERGREDVNLRGIVKAEKEAQRFLAAAKEVREEARDYAYSSFMCGTKKTAALRRASMDLSRALAEMRKS